MIGRRQQGLRELALRRPPVRTEVVLCVARDRRSTLSSVFEGDVTQRRANNSAISKGSAARIKVRAASIALWHDRKSRTYLEIDKAAVDEQFGTGGVGRICGEVESCRGDFGGGAGAAERNAGLGALDETVLLSRCQAAFVEDRGDDRTGADGVHPAA
jgi:hypothetical protein